MDLFVKFDFAASRRLPRLPPDHPCSRLHGHTFLVELRLRGEVAADSGWMIDFGALEQQIAGVNGRLDHHYLNDIEGLDNPTTEILAIWLWQQFVADCPQLYRIKVQEHASRGVVYYGPGT